MAGIFVGTANGGVYGAANSKRGNHQSIRWRAPRTGLITEVLIQNRHNTGILIHDRALAAQVYQDCLDYWAAQGTPIPNDATYAANIEAQKCAYTTGNYYSAGNGGTQIFEIRPDVGGIPGPMSSIIGKTVTPFEPLFNQVDRMTVHVLDEPAEVLAGCCYHIVVRNLTPVPLANISNLTLAEAYAMPDNVGAFSLNGIEFANSVDVAGQQGPYFTAQATLNSQDITTDPTTWDVDPNTQGWWGAKYSTGQWTGYHSALFDTARTLDINDPSAYNSNFFIGGARRAKQLFTATHATVVDGIWVMHGHSGTANGQPMLAELGTGATVLATATIPHDAAVNAAVSASTSFRDYNSNIWSYQPLSTPVNLVAGTQYNIEFSAPAGADFRMFGLAQDWTGSYNPYAEEIANDTEAQRSEDGGATWGNYPGTATSFQVNRSLQTILTVEGMPRELSEEKVEINLPLTSDVTVTYNADGSATYCNNNINTAEITTETSLQGFPLFLASGQCSTISQVPNNTKFNVTYEEPCTGTVTVCALGESVSKNLTPTRISDTQYQWTDASGAVVTLELSYTPTASGCTIVFINAIDPYVIISSDTACGPTPIEFIDLSYKFTTDLSNLCSIGGCPTTVQRIRTRIRDVDITIQGGITYSSCVTPTVFQNLEVIGGTYTQNPIGTYCATGAIPGEGNLYIGDKQEPPGNFETHEGVIRLATGGERIAFEVDAVYRLGAQTILNCLGTIQSAQYCTGEVVTDFTAIETLGTAGGVLYDGPYCLRSGALCTPPSMSAIVNGQTTITNPNDVPMTITISSGSATFQNPIPANSTVTVTNIVGGDGVNAAGEAIKTFCITGNC